MFFMFNSGTNKQDRINAELNKKEVAELQSSLEFLVLQYDLYKEPHYLDGARAIVTKLGLESKVVQGYEIVALS